MELADRAVELSRQNKEPGHGAWALKLCGDIAMRQGAKHPAPAEARYREALNLAANMAMRPLQAHCHAGLAQVYTAAGNSEKARQELGEAQKLFRAIGMASFLATSNGDLAHSD
jgi:ATP/maltotriose-dependent transcriptional regulator MalT